MPVVPGGDALVAVRPDEDAGRLGVAPPDEDLLGDPPHEFSNLQTQAVTPLMTIVEEASQLPTVLVKPQEVGVMFDPGNPVSSLEHLSILSPASNTQDNCLLQHASVLSPHQAQSVLSTQHVQSVLSPQHVQSVLSPHQAHSIIAPGV